MRSIVDFISTYRNEEIPPEVIESVAGRVMSIRTKFYDLYADGIKLQVCLGLEVKEVLAVHNCVKRGDIVGVTGCPGFTKTGELIIYASKVAILCPCLHELPEPSRVDVSETTMSAAGKSWNLKSCELRQETRYRQHYLDMLLNREVIQIMRTRAEVVSYIRPFLYERTFLEVETPIMNLIPSEGAAKPYKSLDEASKCSFYMHTAPGLFLKELLVGGISRVFEIGKQFRDEGSDATHYPKCTSCEFYMAYADSEVLMPLTEELLSGLIHKLTGGYKIMYHSNGMDKDPIEIDFTPPFRKIDMIEELERVAKVSIPRPFSSPEARECLMTLCNLCHIKCDPDSRTATLLDKLVGHYLEGLCVNPTFIINYPEIMTKRHRSKPRLTVRFELFVDRKELCNAYTVPNDQEEQLKLGKADEDEAMHIALDYGWPPCAGCGIHIDRLLMLLTNSKTLEEINLFTY